MFIYQARFRRISPKEDAQEKESSTKSHKILVLELDKLAPIIQLMDDLSIKQLGDHVQLCPLWSLSSIDVSQYKGLPIEITISDKLKHIQEQMLGIASSESCEIPKEVRATLRSYQHDGISWLNRLREMHLNGILADDMGLGKPPSHHSYYAIQAGSSQKYFVGGLPHFPSI